jgi:hypothetical protein
VTNELNTLIREVADDYPRADPRELARHVAKLTPDESVVDFYVDALIDRIREIIGGNRRNLFDGPDNRSTSNRSPKVEQRRSWWADLLASRVHVGNAEWLQIAECSVDDLKFCIEERRTQIAGYEKQIGNFDRLIRLMRKHKALKVSDLPAQTDWLTQ